jgi:heat shock protein 4
MSAHQTKYKIDIKSNPKALFRLRTACERAKKMLSANQQAPVSVECIMNDVDVSGMITREQFEELASHVLEKVEVPLKTALASAGIPKESVDAIEIIGGSSRVPLLKEKIRNFFGKELSTTLNSDEAVAKGAALQCAIISPVFRVREFEIKDVSPFDVEIVWEPLSGDEETGTLPIIPARCQYPATKALTLYRRNPFKLTLRYSNPENLPVGVNPIISVTEIKDIKPPSNGDALPLKIKVKININGIIEVASVSVSEEVGAENEQPNIKTGSNEELEEEKTEEKKTTKKTVKKELIFTSVNGSLSTKASEALREAELEMASSDQLVRDTEERRNALEEYIYEARNKLSTTWSSFAEESDKSYLQNELTKAEDWLYGDGEEATKSSFVEKLKELKVFQLNDLIPVFSS